MIDTFYKNLTEMCNATNDLSAEAKCAALMRVTIERGFDELGDLITLAMITKCLSITMDIMAVKTEDDDQETEYPDDWSLVMSSDTTKH